MNEHVLDRILSFINDELSQSEKKHVAEHLLLCEDCRREHDELKLAASALSQLPRVDAPPPIWPGIRDAIDGRDMPTMGLIPQAAWLDRRKGFAFVISLVAVSVIAAAVYIGLFSEGSKHVADRGGRPAANPAAAEPSSEQTGEILSLNSTNAQANSNSNANGSGNLANSNTAPATVPAWQVETLAGMPTIGTAGAGDQIAVGQSLETDARSKAKITVANIGSVEVAPNTLVKFVGTGTDQHRLALERGQLHAKIFAPPRLFVVDTPSGQAVDLGCEYTLKVDRVGNSILHVTAGFVALEDKGRESIVPAGMMCLTRKGKGLGTPFSAEADADFRRALEQFDFGSGGRAALQTILTRAEFYDMITLWHLLSRAPKEERGAVFDRLARFVAPPAGVTREGIVSLDKKMLAAWRAEVENTWFS